MPFELPVRSDNAQASDQLQLSNGRHQHRRDRQRRAGRRLATDRLSGESVRANVTLTVVR
jgi:hypothetical protein